VCMCVGVCVYVCVCVYVRARASVCTQQILSNGCSMNYKVQW
jgi:hypothetical protein